MTRANAGIWLTALVACLCLVGCAGSQTTSSSRAAADAPAHWAPRQHVRGVVDLSAPRSSGSLVIAAAGRLSLLLPSGQLRPFALRYSAPRGLEPYIALSSGQRSNRSRCRFAPNALFALRLSHGDGVTLVDGRGAVRRFARLPGRGLENGIAFDGSGRFGHRLLVTSAVAGRTRVFAIDCRGHSELVTPAAPRLEGGIVVAPESFGRFAGDLIAPDELSGTIYAIAPDGRSSVVARSGLPHGQDIGVESEGFVPERFGEALVADRGTRGNRHPGDDLILGLAHKTLAGAGVSGGDLLVVSEGGAKTIAVRCAASCRVRHIADGPSRAHIEGHIVFSAPGT